MVIIMGDGQAHVEGVFSERREAVIMAMHWNNHFFGSQNKDFFAEVQKILDTWNPKKDEDYEFEDNGNGGNGVVVQSLNIPKVEKWSREEVKCLEEEERERGTEITRKEGGRRPRTEEAKGKEGKCKEDKGKERVSRERDSRGGRSK